jgi:uroporphyrinogen-III synthase
MYRSVPADVKTLLTQTAYDGICFFTPSGVLSLFENIPDFKQNGLVLGAFGNNTIKAMEDRGLQLQIKAPQPQAPSMVAALERYLALGKLRG